MLPVFKLHFKCNFKMLKNLNTKFSGYILKFYMFKKWFHRKPTFWVPSVKKTNFCVKEGCVRDVLFVFFTQVTKNVGFSQDLMCAPKMLIRKREIFCLIFLNILKCFFRWQEHMLPCAELNFREFYIYKFFIKSKLRMSMLISSILHNDQDFPLVVG
jgi:hypothetical protein